jgi:hypothetical protein
MSWQEDLGALVEQAMAFAQSVKGKSIPVKPLAEPVAEPMLVVIEQALRAEPLSKAALSPITWAASEREEIKQRVANFKAHQLRMQTEREDYFTRTMMQTRAILADTPPKPLES